MLGLGTVVTSIDSGQIYKELSELSNYADLDIHFDFSTLTGAHGDEVTAVTNLGKTGANNDIDSNEGTPLLDRTTLSRSCVVFDGSNEVLDLANSYTTTGKPCTFFIVFQRDDVSNDYVVANADDGATDFVRFTASGGTDQTTMAGEDAVSTNTNNTNPTGTSINYTQVINVPTVIAFRRDTAGSIALYADNGLFIAQKTNAAIKAAANFTLGAIGGTTSGSLADLTGYIGEVGLYDADISEEEIITLTKELSTKWGISRRS